MSNISLVYNKSVNNVVVRDFSSLQSVTAELFPSLVEPSFQYLDDEGDSCTINSEREFEELVRMYQSGVETNVIVSGHEHTKPMLVDEKCPKKQKTSDAHVPFVFNTCGRPGLCQLHDGMPTHLFCKECKMFVCILCRDYEQVHKYHTIDLISHVEQEFKQMLSTYQEKSASFASQLSAFKQQQPTVLLQNLNSTYENGVKECNEFFNNLIISLQQQHKASLQALQQTGKDNESKLAQFFTQLDEYGAIVNNISEANYSNSNGIELYNNVKDSYDKVHDFINNHPSVPHSSVEVSFDKELVEKISSICVVGRPVVSFTGMDNSKEGKLTVRFESSSVQVPNTYILEVVESGDFSATRQVYKGKETVYTGHTNKKGSFYFRCCAENKNGVGAFTPFVKIECNDESTSLHVQLGDAEFVPYAQVIAPVFDSAKRGNGLLLRDGGVIFGNCQTNWGTVLGTDGFSEGRWYWELRIIRSAGSGWVIPGVALSEINLQSWVGSDSYGLGWLQTSWYGGANIMSLPNSYPTTCNYNVGDRIGMLLDLTSVAPRLLFFVNKEYKGKIDLKSGLKLYPAFCVCDGEMVVIQHPVLPDCDFDSLN